VRLNVQFLPKPPVYRVLELHAKYVLMLNAEKLRMENEFGTQDHELEENLRP
jgi:hypothetical protein